MPKTILVQFRETERARNRMKQAAEKEGLSLSEWLRYLAFRRMAELEDLLEPS